MPLDSTGTVKTADSAILQIDYDATGRMLDRIVIEDDGNLTFRFEKGDIVVAGIPTQASGRKPQGFSSRTAPTTIVNGFEIAGSKEFSQLPKPLVRRARGFQLRVENASGATRNFTVDVYWSDGPGREDDGAPSGRVAAALAHAFLMPRRMKAHPPVTIMGERWKVRAERA